MTAFVGAIEFLHERAKQTARANPSLHEWHTDEWIHITVISVVFAVLYVAIGPGHVEAVPMVYAFPMWFFQGMVGFVALMGSTRFLVGTLGRFAAVAAVLPGALAVTTVSLGFEWAFPAMRDSGWDAPSLMGEVLSDFMTIFVQVAVIWLIYNVAFLFKSHGASAPLPPQDAPDTGYKPTTGMDKIPPELGTDLVAISSEQHYLRVYTVRGNCLVHGTMDDAMTLLADRYPVRIHRSHCISLRHLTEISAQGHAALSSGLSLPISKRNMRTVKDAHRVFCLSRHD